MPYATKGTYYCRTCKHRHSTRSKIGKQHSRQKSRVTAGKQQGMRRAKRKFGNRWFTIHNTYRTKTQAKKEAQKMRNMYRGTRNEMIARVVKVSDGWAVYWARAKRRQRRRR